MPDSRVFVFVDNSNIFIGGQEVYAEKHTREMAARYRVDFGSLFDHVTAGRGRAFFSFQGRQFPKLYGSEPPPMDTLWNGLKAMGVETKVFTRNAFNKEKEVDTALLWDAAELILRGGETGRGDIIAILAGDKDFLKIYGEGRRVGYQVEFYSWRKSTAREIWTLQAFHDLTPHLDEIGFLEKDRFHHDFGEIDWSKAVPYR